MVSNDILNQFNQDGYIILKNCISEENVHTIRQEINNKFHSHKEVGKTGSVSNLFSIFPSLLSSVFNKKCLDALNILFNNDFIITPESSLSYGRLNRIHKDTTSWEMNNYFPYERNDKFLMVTIALYLQNNDQNSGGGLFVVPGSHKDKEDPFVKIRKSQFNIIKRVMRKLGLESYEDQYRKKVKPYEKTGIDLPTEIGDIVIFNVKTSHRASHNLSSNISYSNQRMAIFNRAVINDSKEIKLYLNYLRGNPGYHEPKQQYKLEDKVIKEAKKLSIETFDFGYGK